MLGGFPIVAGPIVVFVALEQGPQFGALAAIAAISAIAGLLVFGIAYCWASIRWPWPAALASGIGCWFLAAAVLSILPASLEVALAVAGASLVLTPRVLPPGGPRAAGGSLNDLPYRMITGALLTLAVTGAAATLGEVWSGLLAVFPSIGIVLAVFTHRAQGPRQVAHIYHGMVKGLYSFGGFFAALAVCWPRMGFWSACGVAVLAALAIQAIVQGLSSPNKALQPMR